jgi:hypothetical protein
MMMNDGGGKGIE